MGAAHRNALASSLREEVSPCPSHNTGIVQPLRSSRSGTPYPRLVGFPCPAYTRQAVAVRRHRRFASCGSCIHLLEDPMPISHVGEIAYQPASPTGGIRLQANPPVCNRCWHEITPQNFGRASVVGQAPSPSRFEFIECTGCTTVRARAPETTLFWVQHQR
jgi:hypothetical protein